MTLDMSDDTKPATLSYKMNDQAYGVAFDTIDIDKSYFLCVTLYNTDEVQLLE